MDKRRNNIFMVLFNSMASTAGIKMFDTVKIIFFCLSKPTLDTVGG